MDFINSCSNWVSVMDLRNEVAYIWELVASWLKHDTKARKYWHKIYVSIPHVGSYQLDTLLKEVIDLRKGNWTYKVWVRIPAIIDKSDGSSRQFIVQNFDPKYFRLDKIGWTHDHCEFCSHTISDIEGYGNTNGYESNNEWLCKVCYRKFIEPKDIDTLIKGLELP